MFKGVKSILATGFGCLSYLACQAMAWADETAGIATQESSAVASKAVEITKSIAIPFGSAIIFISIVVAAIKLIATAGRAEERGKVISSLPFILGGGLLLGSAVLVAGWIVGLMLKAGQ